MNHWPFFKFLRLVFVTYIVYVDNVFDFFEEICRIQTSTPIRVIGKGTSNGLWVGLGN